MPERLFVFIQMEFPWALGPQDGRYVLRPTPDADPTRVVVLGTLGARRVAIGREGHAARRRLRGERRTRPASPEPAAVVTARVTVIDPISLSAEMQARAWLDELDRERDVSAAFAVVNEVLHRHRIASADPYVHEVAPSQALVVRAGWGEGEQVADGHWVHARELPRLPDARRTGAPRRRALADRSAALRPAERLAALLGARGTSLLCEELALRARLDLDHGRLRHAALELDNAYASALSELRAERRQDLAIRLAELEQLRAGVAEQALRAIPAGDEDDPDGPEQEPLEHALARLEAALRARTATGVSVRS